MSTTVTLADNITVNNSPGILAGISLNYVLDNTGPATLDAQINLVLVQDVGGVGETSTIFQSWKKFNISPGEKTYFDGTYFLSAANANQVISDLNPSLPQKYQILCVITGGSSDSDRLALVKMSISGAIDYSITYNNVN